MNESNFRMFRMLAHQAGFKPDQIEFMWEHMAMKPHTHSIDEVRGLEDELEEIGYEPGSENDSEDDEEEDIEEA